VGEGLGVRVYKLGKKFLNAQFHIDYTLSNASIREVVLGSLRANLFQSSCGNDVTNHQKELYKELQVWDSARQDEKR
jgi:hypothetical protein